jgi:hypothetical protein
MKTHTLPQSSAKLRLAKVQFIAFLPYMLSVLALLFGTGCTTTGSNTLVVDHAFVSVDKPIQCISPTCQKPIYLDLNSTTSFEKKATFDKYNGSLKDVYIECLENANLVCQKTPDLNTTK